MRNLTVLLCISALLTVEAVRGDDIVWNNPAGGNWNTAANWSPSFVPDSDDIAVITNAGTYTVTLNANATIAGLVLGGDSGTQTLAQAASALTLNGTGTITTNGRYDFSGGTFTGTNLVDFAGVLDWSGGTIAANAAIAVATNGVVNLQGANIKVLNGTITNAGTVTWTDAGMFRILGVFHNLPDGLFHLQTSATLDFNSGSPLFVNEGAVRKTVSTGSTEWQVELINSGTLDTQTGGINFPTGSVFNDGTQFTGAGTNRFASATMTLNGTIVSENLLLAGASCAGNWTLDGVLAWTGGTIAAGGSLTVSTGGVVILSGTVMKAISGAVTNAGTVTWTDTGMFRILGVCHNLSDGLFHLQSSATLDFNGGSPIFVNEGTIRKTVSSGDTDWQVTLINSGTVDTQTGRISFPGGSEFNDGSQLTGAGTNRLWSGSVALNGSISSENLELSGATLTGAGSFTGSLSWLSGTIAGSLNLFIPTNGVLLLAGSGTKQINGTVTNAGHIQWEGTGIMRLVGTLHNLESGLFDLRNSATLDFTGGSPLFVNEGIIRKTVSTGNTDWQVALRNSGKVDIQTGRISFPGGSEFNDGSSLTGGGTNRLFTGSVVLNGNIYSDNLELSGATLTGAGSFTGTLRWLNGTIAGSLNLFIPTNGLLHLVASGIKTINGTVTNAGFILWEGTGDLRLLGTLHNLPGGLLDVRSNELLDFFGGTPLFINQGTLRKSAGAGTTTVQILCRNAGTVEINSGEIYFDGGFTNLSGQVGLGGGTLRLDGGQTLDLNGGALTGFGTVSAHLRNDGFLSATPANAVLQATGNYTQTLAGRVAFDLAGTAPGTNHSQLRVTGAAALDGGIAVRRSGGYAPQVNDTFVVLTCGSLSGDFQCQDGFLILGHDLRLEATYHPTNVTLTAVAGPDPVSPTLSIRHEGGWMLLSWPPEFTGYHLEQTDALAPSDWQPVPGEGCVSLLLDASAPHHFFRLVKP